MWLFNWYAGTLTRWPFVWRHLIVYGLNALYALMAFGVLVLEPASIWTAYVIFMLAAMLWLFTYVYSLGLTVRRLHDCGLSGWWCLMTFISPLIMTVILALWPEIPAADNPYHDRETF